MFSQRFSRLAGPALIAGGLLWIAIYVDIVVIGATTGQLAPDIDAHSSVLVRIGAWVEILAVFVVCVGQLGVFARLSGRSRWLGIAGVVFTALSMAAIIANLILVSGITGRIAFNSGLGGMGTFAASVGAGLLGWAALRARVLPRRLGWILIGIGLVTIPIFIATPLPIGPNWATDFAAFLVSGIAYTVVGVTLMVAPTHVDENARVASVSTVAQAK